MKLIEEEVGKTFGSWIVISEPIRKPGRRVRYLCRCSCGKEQEVEANNLRSKMSTSCFGCRNKRLRKDIRCGIYKNYKSSAKKRGPVL